MQGLNEGSLERGARPVVVVSVYLYHSGFRRYIYAERITLEMICSYYVREIKGYYNFQHEFSGIACFWKCT